jgi:hypothetical protein
MSTPIQLGVFIDCGEGLRFVTNVLLNMLLSVEEVNGVVTLTYIDGKTRELTAAQGEKFLTTLGLKESRVLPVAALPRLTQRH